MSLRAFAQKLTAEAVDSGRSLEWFETLYPQAAGDATAIPWVDLTVNPNLSEWLTRTTPDGAGRRALVIGCGLGDDAEALAERGFQTTAFDISETCVDWCRQRFSGSPAEISAKCPGRSFAVNFRSSALSD